MKGRLALVHLLSLLALCAGFLLLGGNAPDGETNAPDALSAFKTDRAQTRARLTQTLLTLRNDPDEVVQREAAALLLEIAQRADVENTLEGVLRARGYKDACATVRPGSVNILVRGEMTPAQAATILELALRETGEAPQSVKIIPVS